MKQTKRILSVVLCLLMLIAVVPVMEVSATCCKKDNFDKSRYTLTGDMAYDVAMIAKSQKGRTCTDFGYDGVDYGAWCDEYVADCIENAGADDSIVAHGGTVADFESEMRKRGAVEVTSPKAGDLVFFTWSHVEIVTKVENGVPYCAGGNNGSYPGCCNGERKISSVGSYRLFLRPNYRPSSIPQDLSISANKTSFAIGETITFSFSYKNADTVAIPIDRNGAREYFISVLGQNTYSMELTKTGTYYFCLYATNAKGEAATKYYRFDVYDSPPTDLSISINKTEFMLGETATFTFKYTGADSVAIPIDRNGAREYFISVLGQNTYSMELTKTGTYYFCLYATNAKGEAATEYYRFDVYDSVPEGAWIWSDRTSVPVHGEVKFNYNATFATHFVLGVWDGKDLAVTDVGSNNWHTVTFDKAGTFKVHVAAYNEFGHVDTENIVITVYDPDHNHSYASSITKAATCSATGVKTYTCTVCNATKTETIAVNPNNHVNTTNTAATASTCTAKGYTAGVYCNDCKKYISGHAEQPLAAHTVTTQNAKAATCAAEGYTGDQVCTVCKQTITKGTAIAKKAHTLTTVNKSNPGCTTAGYTGDQYCTTCKQTITKGSAINALGHTSPDSNGNCTRCGQHIKDVPPSQPSNPQPNPNACKYCGQVHTGPFGWMIKFFHSILAIFKR